MGEQLGFPTPPRIGRDPDGETGSEALCRQLPPRMLWPTPGPTPPGCLLAPDHAGQHDNGYSRWGDPPTTAHARASDPDTSHQAAASIGDLTGRQHAVLAVLQRLGEAHDAELINEYQRLSERAPASYPPQADSGIRTRRAELAAAGWIADSGGRAVMASGRRAIVWVPTVHQQQEGQP